MQIFSKKSQQLALDTKTIILFDGVCSFCDASVQFVLERDAKGYFHFASLQSELGQFLLDKYNLPQDLSTIVLIENKQAFTKSTAVLRITRHLTGLWPLLYSFTILPVGFRNIVYTWIANNRYNWFGRKDLACTLPSIDVRKRFLK